MYLAYSLLLTLGFIVLIPHFLRDDRLSLSAVSRPPFPALHEQPIHRIPTTTRQQQYYIH